MYRNINDYEILYMVCDCKDNTFNVLLQKYQPLIYKQVKNYVKFFKRFGYELDDLMQIGYITLYKASYLYNDSYNSTLFYSYFKSALNNAILACIKLNTTNRKEVLNNVISYDVKIPNTGLYYIDLFQDKNNSIDYSKELISFKNSMPFYLSWTFELFYNGYSKEEISIILDEKLDTIKGYFSKIKEHALTYKPLFLE